VFAYELLAGKAPFIGDDDMETYQLIRQCSVKWDSKVKDKAKNLISKLLVVDPAKRIGPTVKAHPFFAGLDWTLLMERQIVPAYQPFVNDETDTSNFDE
jgi:serine/threonine protein kinase